MSSRRTVILVAAVLVGVVSAFLVFNYVNSADDRAQGNAKRVPVLVVKKDIPRGLTGREAQAQGYIKRDEIQSQFKPATAINDPTVIENKVAVAKLATGQVLVDGMFADQIDSQITFAGRVPEQCGPTSASTGKLEPCVAITLQFNQTQGVAGVIVPGDFVNILINPTDTGNCRLAQNGAVTEQGASGGKAVFERLYPDIAASQQQDRGLNFCNPSRYLYQAVQVLFVDKTAVPQPGESTASTTQVQQTGGLITFAVPPEAAQLLASVESDKLYLTLLPTNYTPYPLPPVNAFPAVLPGEDQAQLTPYGPQGIQKK